MPQSAKVLLATAFCLALLTAAGCGNSEAPPAASLSADRQLDGQSSAPSDLDVQTSPSVVIATSLGKITVELDRVRAPLTVDNFLNYVAEKRYDRTIFHQVEAGSMALAGGYGADLREISADFPIRNEAHSGLKNLRGTIAMARPADSIDGATSQFFFNLVDSPTLDYQADSIDGYGYAVFGRVTAGLEVLDKIASVEVVDNEYFPQTPRAQVVIESIRRLP
jgi:cyclophilin family peptidyl-prolyl cis-trans isomerase